MYNQASYLIHFGILGQKWGVRRFQNEDGTLTEEGRRRYLKNFEDAERKADQDLERAQKQLADIDKNGWNARSAFDKGFVKQMRDEGMLNEENLKFFRQTFERDVENALADKKAAKAGKSLISDYKDVTYDDVLNVASKMDKEHKKLTEYDSTRIEKYKKNVESIGDELGLEKKSKNNRFEDNGDGTTRVSVKDYDKETKRKINENYSPREMKELVKSAVDYFKEEAGVDLLTSARNTTTGKSLVDSPIDEQFYFIMKLFNENAFDDLD